MPKQNSVEYDAVVSNMIAMPWSVLQAADQIPGDVVVSLLRRYDTKSRAKRRLVMHDLAEWLHRVGVHDRGLQVAAAIGFATGGKIGMLKALWLVQVLPRPSTRGAAGST